MRRLRGEKRAPRADGWFAGYTSNLLAIVWVGFDDNRDLGLSGANAPAPIWAEFMKRAIMLPAYRNVQPFDMPAGVTRVNIDPETMQLATPECPVTREEVYIQGTEPTEFCALHGVVWPATRLRVPGYLEFLAGTRRKSLSLPLRLELQVRRRPPRLITTSPKRKTKKVCLGGFLVSLGARRTPTRHSREHQIRSGEAAFFGGVFRHEYKSCAVGSFRVCC